MVVTQQTQRGNSSRARVYPCTVCVVAAPLARIRQAMEGVRRECTQMDIRVGVLQHILLSSRLKEKNRAGRAAATVALDDDDENVLRGY